MLMGNSLEEIIPRSKIVKVIFKKGEIGIVGGVYNAGNEKERQAVSKAVPEKVYE